MSTTLAPTAWAGYQRHTTDTPHGLVVLVDGHDQGVTTPGDGDGRWCLICDRHGSILTDTNKRRLWTHAKAVADWCHPEAQADGLTVADIEAGLSDERWLGWGYLGERQRNEDDGITAVADDIVLEQANLRSWDAETLFAWLNSKAGRWFGDLAFGSGYDRSQVTERANRQHLFATPRREEARS